MKKIFHSYGNQVEKVLSGIRFDLDSEDAVKLITDKIIQELGTEFPELTRDQVEEFTREAWEIGQAWEVGVKDIAPLINQDVIDFFGRLNNADYGKLFNSQREIFEESIRSVLEGKKTKGEALKELKEKLGVDLKNKDITGRIEDIFRNKVYTSQNFSRIQRMHALGITDVEIVAIMDAKTSPICRELNGRKFQVSEMNDFVEEFISTPTDENFWNKYRPPTAKEIRDFPSMKSSEILKALAVKCPPFHFRCRTTIVMFVKSVINRITGNVKTPLNGELKNPEKILKRDRDRIEARKKSLSGLEPDEFVNKIASVQGNAVWNSDKLRAGWKKRIAEGNSESFGKTEATYATKGLDVLKNFNTLYAYSTEDKKTKSKSYKFGFVQNQKDGGKFFVPVNAETFEIENLFELESESFTNSFLKVA
ncbi:phage protein F-like protein [Leptospira interrogans str. 2003000735]|uniref:Phage protein F-like protein n=2 Tax=Leptospira interrogans TaxID=173 RepID=A0A829D5G2_LEPIR|nr:minor capsid protein [Leptospira interrogans]EMY06283.1 phage protein F-like protein [Leptospira interrogans str. 2002000626]EMY25601.1 phage protein F-like protein [Leptospira interrogans serovar Australis str. 200703203]EKN89867.1 phage protein F-like protein [Leptospira interrogans str. 2002000624]EKQ40206.1 phage protein F-like protein [Leptospira interrogans str. 2002000621]EKQ46111.1 phage protein F-like protein [Leptospira interrogans str. 2002000623]